MASRGVTPTMMRGERGQLPPSDTMKPLSKSSQRSHQRVKERFDTFLSKCQIPLRGVVFATMDEIIATDYPFIPQELLQPFLLWHATGSVPTKHVDGVKNKRIQRSSLLNFYAVLCAVWRRTRQLGMTPLVDREKGLNYCYQLIRQLGLSDTPTIRAQLDRSSLEALHSKLFDPLHPLSLRRRLTMLLFIALSAQTGLRPSSFIRPSGPAGEKFKGACYGDFQLSVVRVEGGSEIHGYYTPRFAKTKASADLTFPLPPGPTLATSTCHLLLICLYLDGGIHSGGLERLSRSDYLAPGQESRLIDFPSE